MPSPNPPPRKTIKYWGNLCPALLAFLQEQPLYCASTREAYRALRQRHAFPAEWMDPVESSGGEPRYENYIRFAREYLCEHGLVYRSWRRGFWKLTPRGIQTPPTDCPAPSESFKSKVGVTLDEAATVLQQFEADDPEGFQDMLERLGIS